MNDGQPAVDAMHADEARAIGEGGRRDLVRVRVRVGVSEPQT